MHHIDKVEGVSGLRIAEGYELPDTIVTETVAILAKRGMGKSNAAVALAEEMWAAGHQWVAIDPKSDWWGIRSSADGAGPGLPVPIFGGRHGDVPLEPAAGHVMATLVVERGLTCIIDVSLMSKSEQIRFVTDFAETLFRAVGDDPRPLHLFLEEAEEFLPQRVDARAARMVGAYSKISKQGRAFGLGVTLITQRSASLNKDALSQTDTLVLFRTVSPHDRKAVVAWAEHHDESKEVAQSLAELEPGESWIISPGFLGAVDRIRWRRRRTFDSGATPSTGMPRRAPVTLAEIDLGEIRGLLANATGPAGKGTADTGAAALRREIADLRAQLAGRPAAVEVPVLSDDATAVLREAIATYRAAGERLAEVLAPIAAAIEVARRPAAPPPPQPARPPRPPQRSAVAPATVDRGTPLARAERAILTVLAQHGRRSTTQVAILAGYSAKSGGYRNALSSLRTAGYITGRGDVEPTPAGVAALGAYEPLPTGRALVDWWCGQLGKAERSIFTTLVEMWPRGVPVDEIAALTGYSPTSGGFRNALSRLRSLELASGRGALRAADAFGFGRAGSEDR
jgi:hypothetical protein